jgi:hypothetical protein
MSPPGEIRVVNPESRAVFRAHPTGLYAPMKDAFQYRVKIPGVELSLVTIDVTSRELRAFLFDGQPIPVKPVL